MRIGTASGEGDYHTHNHVNNSKKSLALTSGKPLFPLPSGRYPAYNGFPKSILNMQITEREKVLSLDREVVC